MVSFPFLSRPRSEEHTSELQSPIDISYAVFCLKKKTTINSASAGPSTALPGTVSSSSVGVIFFFNDTATTEIYTSIDTLSLHDALPISGGVGSLAVQLARNAGVHVIATARQSKAAALEQLGAERVIDITRERLEDIEQVDAVLNLIGGDTVVPSYALVKPGGVAVTANRPPIAEEAARLGIEAAFVETNVTTEGLNAFATLVTDGKIKPQIAAVETLWSP